MISRDRGSHRFAMVGELTLFLAVRDGIRKALECPRPKTQGELMEFTDRVVNRIFDDAQDPYPNGPDFERLLNEALVPFSEEIRT